MKLADIKVGYFEKLYFVDNHRDHRETFGDNPMVFLANPTKQEKTMSEKELYAFSELCIFDVFIHIIRNNYCGTYNVDDSRSTQEVCQAITNLKYYRKEVNSKTVILTP